MTTHDFDAELYLWKERPDSWVFLDLPREVSDRIDESYAGPPRGFGSVRVRVTIGSTTWETSVFPSKESQTYVLPVKKAVRRAEDVEPGDEVRVSLEVRD